MRAFMVSVVVAFVVLGAGTAWGAPGDPDTSFAGGAAKAFANFGGQETGNALALEPDGKIVVAGSSTAGHPVADFAVAVFTNPGGILDPAYNNGSGGSLGDLGGFDEAEAVAVQRDGAIVTAGFRAVGNGLGPNAFDFAVVRFAYPQGNADASFGGGSGVGIGNLGGNEFGRAVALEPNGKIVVAGGSTATHTAQDFAVAVFTTPQGVLDPSYGPGGAGASLGDLGASESAAAVALQPDGKIVTAGTRFIDTAQDSHDADFAVVRFTNPQGTADASFGGGSGVGIGDLGGRDIVGALALEPDGGILVAGGSDAVGSNEDFAVARFTDPQGTLDPSYGTGGKTLVDFGADAEAGAAVLQPDGKLVVAGTIFRPGNRDIGLVRLQPDGSLDTTFGTNGKVIFDLGGTDDKAAGVALQADGKIVVAGTSNAKGTPDFAVARFQGDPPATGADTNPPGGGLGPAPTGGGGPPRCAGKRATIIGTARGDKLTGTKRADVIVALGGKDTIKGARGNDTICAGAGNDHVDGGSGKDRLFGQNGKDALAGGSGNDTLSGGNGKDNLTGNGGKDRLLGQGGRDRCTGGTGHDHATCEVQHSI
jgi:uncharacterized delta-60 repeat protein